MVVKILEVPCKNIIGNIAIKSLIQIHLLILQQGRPDFELINNVCTTSEMIELTLLSCLS